MLTHNTSHPKKNRTTRYDGLNNKSNTSIEKVELYTIKFLIILLSIT